MRDFISSTEFSASLDNLIRASQLPKLFVRRCNKAADRNRNGFDARALSPRQVVGEPNLLACRGKAARTLRGSSIKVHPRTNRLEDDMNIDEFVLGQNIAHYRDQLKTEANKVKQQTLRNLLAEAETGLAESRLTQTATRRQSTNTYERRAPHAEPFSTP